MNWRSLPLLEHNPGPASHWPTVEIAWQEFAMLDAVDDVELEYWRSVHETCKGTDEY